MLQHSRIRGMISAGEYWERHWGSVFRKIRYIPYTYPVKKFIVAGYGYLFVGYVGQKFPVSLSVSVYGIRRFLRIRGYIRISRIRIFRNTAADIINRLKILSLLMLAF